MQATLVSTYISWHSVSFFDPADQSISFESSCMVIWSLSQYHFVEGLVLFEVLCCRRILLWLPLGGWWFYGHFNSAEDDVRCCYDSIWFVLWIVLKSVNILSVPKILICLCKWRHCQSLLSFFAVVILIFAMDFSEFTDPVLDFFEKQFFGLTSDVSYCRNGLCYIIVVHAAAKLWLQFFYAGGIINGRKLLMNCRYTQEGRKFWRESKKFL